VPTIAGRVTPIWTPERKRAPGVHDDDLATLTQRLPGRRRLASCVSSAFGGLAVRSWRKASSADRNGERQHDFAEWPVGCHSARTLLLGWVSRDHQAARWYSLISPLTVVRRLIRAVMSMALLGSCIGG